MVSRSFSFDMIVGLPVSIVRPISGVCRRESALLVLPVAASSHPDCPHGLPAGMRNRGGCCAMLQHWDIHRIRSEEHTSELKSLMRISYAVFCLKKKKTTT